jgi:hypothetical protein
MISQFWSFGFSEFRLWRGVPDSCVSAPEFRWASRRQPRDARSCAFQASGAPLPPSLAFQVHEEAAAGVALACASGAHVVTAAR